MTTLGTTLAGTCSTVPGGMFAAGTLGAAPGMILPLLPAVCVPSSTAVAAAPPMPAETTATANAPTTNMPARDRFSGIGAIGGPIGGSIPGIGPVAVGPAIGPTPAPPGIGPGAVPPGIGAGPVPLNGS